ncbi:MAG: 2-keto-4-pentenoate hydratase [Isosphaeraceae bacterium]
MNPDALRPIATTLLAGLDARTPGTPSCRPSDRLSIADAYDLQAEVCRLREGRGERVIGYKVGCTGRPIQEQLNVREPIFGRLFDTGVFRSGACLSHAAFAQLAVEGELAVRLGRDLAGPDVSADECREAIDAVFPVIELHHHVLPADWPPAQWLVASGGLHAGFVFDDAASAGPVSSGFADRLSVRINQVVVGDARGPEALIDPVLSLRWLCGRLARSGVALRAGQTVLTGSPLSLYPAGPGSRIVVDAPPLGSSRVEIVF